MKSLVKYFVVIAAGLILFSCDKPAPTELVDDSANNMSEYEVLSKDVNDEYYSNGGDTTGVTQDLRDFTNLISLSGVKMTGINGNTEDYSFAQAIMFDKTKPVYDSHKRLLAYHTVTPGNITMDHIKASEVPFQIQYRDNGVLMDTTLGNKYILFSRIHRLFHYRHDSKINFRMAFFNNDVVNFDIQTPKEITGNVEMLGSRNESNLRARLTWNSGNTPTVQIIISARLRANPRIVMPLYKVRTNDRGELVVPSRLISQIPLLRFDRLVFTFIRRFEETHDGGNNNLRVSAQSIHSITVNLP